MKVYYDRFYIGMGFGMLFAVGWIGLLLPIWLLIIVALILLVGSYVGYVRTVRGRYNGRRG